MFFDGMKIKEKLDALKTRLHNHSEEDQKAAIGSAMEADFDRLMEKVPAYLLGNQITDRNGSEDPAWFNTLSLGNWLTIAQHLDIKAIPAEIVHAPLTTTPLALMGTHEEPGLPDNVKEDYTALVEQLSIMMQDMSEDDEETDAMVRFDCCAAGAIKAHIDGQDVGNELAGRGMYRDTQGHYHPIIDDRVAEQSFNSCIGDRIPVWLRPMVSLKMRDGVDSQGNEGQFPCEWRVFVMNGKVQAISNYYPQAPVAQDEDVETVVHLVREQADKVIAFLGSIKAYPHHPRYVDQVHEAELHFTLDFAETVDGDLVLVEGGPAHLRHPAWGAHPCCFDPVTEPAGLALTPGTKGKSCDSYIRTGLK